MTAVADGDGLPQSSPWPRLVVVMGVAGSGKTAVGEMLAAARGWQLIEGDRFHPSENIARMSAGLPLADQHRWKWLDAIGSELARARRERFGAVAACSALKRVYRDRLRRYDGNLLFVHLVVDKPTAFARVAAREGHFMPASLIESQFADLEPPADGEDAVTLDGTRPLEMILAETLDRLRLR